MLNNIMNNSSRFFGMIATILGHSVPGQAEENVEKNEKNSLTSPHVPVLLDAVLESFADRDDGVLVDCTLGYAGHSEALLRAHPHLQLVGIDRDPEALAFSEKRLEPFRDRVELLHGSFSTLLPQILATRKISGVLADFGVSSLQLDKMDRGFSFESETLDMRMDPGRGLSAADLVNTYSADRLEYIFREYGEIRQAGRLAQAIVQARKRTPIRSGRELAEIILQLFPRRGRIHPATQPFQAIRIEVNDELGEIERLLDTLEAHPPAGAVVSLITFHSLEDRLVKSRFRRWSQRCICPPEAIRCSCGGDHALGRVLNKKPHTAEAAELKSNSRARSAKLRSFQFRETLPEKTGSLLQP